MPVIPLVLLMPAVPTSRVVTFGLIAAGGLAADLATKHIVFERLGGGRGETPWLLDGWLKFRLYTTFNHGALWGVGQGMTWLFALLSLVAVVGVLYWLFVAGAARSWWLTVALALVMAGTLGNLWDRAGMHGVQAHVAGLAKPQPIFAVRDFLHFRFGEFDWAVFNVADVFLVTGAIMLGLHSFRPEPSVPMASPVPPADPVPTGPPPQ